MAQTSIHKVFDNLTISANSSELSDEMHMLLAQGDCSLEIEITGSGTGKLEFLISNSLSSYMVPDGGGTILSSQTSGSNIAKFSVPACGHMKIKASETGTTDSITVNAWLAIRKD